MFEVFKDLRHKCPGKILMTGHSLGGALATVFIPKLIENFGHRFAYHELEYIRNQSYLYTMGAFRPGNEDLADYINYLYKKCHRVTNE